MQHSQGRACPAVGECVYIIAVCVSECVCVCVYERKVNLLAYTQLTITECVYESRCVRAEAIDISVRRGVVLFSLRACEDVWTEYRERQRKTQQ